MTAEVAVLNTVGVSLAADSAATISGRANKIFTSADKLFNMAIDAPIGIMVYGNASFFDLPWETIIKDYRSKLGTQKFPRLGDYADDFIKYLEANNSLFPPEKQENIARYVIDDYLKYLFFAFEEKLQEFEENNPTLTEEDAQQVLNDLLSSEMDKAADFPAFHSLPEDFDKHLRTEYSKLFKEAKKAKFENFPLSSHSSRKINNLLISILTTVWFSASGFNSGIVIAGFGEEDFFPCLIELNIFTILLDRLLYNRNAECEIGKGTTARIIPFAQKEIVYSYLLGIEPSIELEIKEYITDLFSEVVTKIANVVTDEEERQETLINDLTKPGGLIQSGVTSKLEALQANYSRRVMGMVSHLPKNELAEMAESLVNLTSFKRKISDEYETVGGPIDVAVITKSDGFIWVKRKHYFAPELNPRFMVRYSKETQNE